MYIFIATFVGITTFRVILRLLDIAIGDYPRTVTWSRAEDVLSLLISVAFGIWGAKLLGWI